MVASQQVLKKMTVEKLKGLEKCELEIGPVLTAIMGTNGSGKTTVLHALACSFKPLNATDVGFKFPMFFRPSTDSPWTGSRFSLKYDEREGATLHADRVQKYTKENDRWSPRYGSRPERHVTYLMIRDCVPEIELNTQHTFVRFTKSNRNDVTAAAVRQAAGTVLNRQYTELHSVTYQRGNRKSVGVKFENVSYSALAMSAGEQRILRILEAVLAAPKYGLILIDEIDLFLHQDALRRLLDFLHAHCLEKHKQLVFTTHFPPVANLYEKVRVISLHRSLKQTLVWSGYSFEALQYITGNPQWPITVHVEDDVAQEIVGKVAADLGIRKRVKTWRYGPAINAFTLGAGLVLKGEQIENQLILLDGDVYAQPAERRSQISRILTGDQGNHQEQRLAVTRLVRKLCPPANKTPEQVLHDAIVSLEVDQLPPDDAEIVILSRGIVNPPDGHGFVDEVVLQMGAPRQTIISHMVRLAAKTEAWNRYTSIIRVWLTSRKNRLRL